jgi:hypothetical protein
MSSKTAFSAEIDCDGASISCHTFGGFGGRLWPVSRTHYPKQFIPLVTEYSLVQDRASDGGGGKPGGTHLSLQRAPSLYRG